MYCFQIKNCFWTLYVNFIKTLLLVSGDFRGNWSNVISFKNILRIESSFKNLFQKNLSSFLKIKKINNTLKQEEKQK